jgi:hypothetical protein
MTPKHPPGHDARLGNMRELTASDTEVSNIEQIHSECGAIFHAGDRGVASPEVMTAPPAPRGRAVTFPVSWRSYIDAQISPREQFR